MLLYTVAKEIQQTLLPGLKREREWIVDNAVRSARFLTQRLDLVGEIGPHRFIQWLGRQWRARHDPKRHQRRGRAGGSAGHRSVVASR